MINGNISNIVKKQFLLSLSLSHILFSFSFLFLFPNDAQFTYFHHPINKLIGGVNPKNFFDLIYINISKFAM